MNKQEIIQSRVDKIVSRIERGSLKWTAQVKGSNGQDYVIPEASSKEEFVAALTPVITAIVESELEDQE